VKQKKTKAHYRLRNWSQYNRSPIQRGSLTLQVSEDVLAAWGAKPAHEGRLGCPRRYSEMAILTMATLAEVFYLPLRGAQGFLRSLSQLMRVELEVPDYRTLYRTWRKLHLCVDAATKECVAVAISTNSFKDSPLLPALLGQVSDRVTQVAADGAYDTRSSDKVIAQRGARAVIPPQHNAKIWEHGNRKAERHQRDENLRAIREKGRERWQQESGYHHRSLAETQVFRIKTHFGDRVSARNFSGPAAQLLMRCAALNTMTHCGMPDSYQVAA
jgi:hypothetical protein